MKKILLLIPLLFQIQLHGGIYLLLRSAIYAGSAYIGLKSVNTNEVKHLLYGTAIGSLLIVERIYKISKILTEINQLNTENGVVQDQSLKEKLVYANHGLEHWIFFYGRRPDSLSTQKYDGLNNNQLNNEKNNTKRRLDNCINGTVVECVLASVVCAIPLGLYMKMPK